MIAKEDITGVILAGGRGSRMGGADKGLQNFRGIPLALFTLMRLSPQVGELMILRGCAWISRKRIFSSSRWIARCV